MSWRKEFFIDWFFFFWACCLKNYFSQKLTKCSEAALRNLPLTGCNLTSSSTCHSSVAWQWCFAAMSSNSCRVVHCCLCPTAPKKQCALSNSTWTQLSKNIFVNAAFITLDFQEVNLKLVSPAQLSNENVCGVCEAGQQVHAASSSWLGWGRGRQLQVWNSLFSMSPDHTGHSNRGGALCSPAPDACRQ